MSNEPVWMSSAMQTKQVGSFDRAFLENAGVNLYSLEYVLRDVLMDKEFEQDGERYRITSVFLNYTASKDANLIVGYFAR